MRPKQSHNHEHSQFKATITAIDIQSECQTLPYECRTIPPNRHSPINRTYAKLFRGSLDTTLSGSRNALTPLMLWYAFERYGMEGFRKMVAGCLDVAEYAVGRFRDSGIPAWRHKNSVTVVFPKPSEEVFRKWQIAPYEDIAHIITMPHVTREMIDEVVDDCLRQE